MPHHFRSPLTSGNIEIGTTQITSEYSSTMAGLIGDTNMNLVGMKLNICVALVKPCASMLIFL